MLRLSMIGWRPRPLPGPEYNSKLSISAFILQIYSESHKETVDLDSENEHLFINI